MAKKYRVAVIGRTGRGNYGHALDVAVKTYPGMDVVAVADENPEGLKLAAERLRTRANYADYAKMLRDEDPEIVVIGPRWVDCHLDMCLAAAEAGASIFMEKPMGRTPAECDRIIGACDKAGTKIVVAHNFRVNPILDHVRKRIGEGLIGDVLELRCRGKEDRRAGGEDLMVLGTHNFDLMRQFAGDPLWATGRVTVKGRPLTRAGVNRNPPEGLGYMAGDTITGEFAFPNGITAYFGSKHSSEQSGKRWGMDVYGSRGIIAIRLSHVPEIYHSESITWTNAPWKRLPIPEGTLPRTNLEANHLLVRDLVDAIEGKREPVAGGRTARWTLEMAMALYESELTGKRVAFPLVNREHPLAG